MLRLGYLRAVDFRQTIYIIITLALKSEVLCKIYYLHMLRNLMLLQESLALAMTETEEHNVDIIERHLGSELQVGIAVKTFMHVGNKVAGIALAVDKRDFGFGVVDKYADKLTGCVAGSAEDSYFHRILYN